MLNHCWKRTGGKNRIFVWCWGVASLDLDCSGVSCFFLVPARSDMHATLRSDKSFLWRLGPVESVSFCLLALSWEPREAMEVRGPTTSTHLNQHYIYYCFKVREPPPLLCLVVIYIFPKVSKKGCLVTYIFNPYAATLTFLKVFVWYENSNVKKNVFPRVGLMKKRWLLTNLIHWPINQCSSTAYNIMLHNY